MQSINLRPPVPERDFSQIAALISSQEIFHQGETDLREDYDKNEDTRLLFRVAEDAGGSLMGFCWLWRSWLHADQGSFNLVVKPERRNEGAGRALYAALESEAQKLQLKRLDTTVLDTSPESLAFIQRRGFIEYRHGVSMELDLDAFDDSPYDTILARLEHEGFCFTNMEELGNTEEAQRKLYALNDLASRSTPGQSGDPSWASFEEFQKTVCSSAWYRPAGQVIAIDTATGSWAGMSAITRMPGVDFAYNLFTGVDFPYRGRQLGQAVKVLALRYARQNLGVHSVHTDHNTKNLPMLAIDHKLGYRQTLGRHLVEKFL